MPTCSRHPVLLAREPRSTWCGLQGNLGGGCRPLASSLRNRPGLAAQAQAADDDDDEQPALSFGELKHELQSV